jgi:hypothetical protein
MLLTEQQAAEEAQVDRRTIRRLITTGQLKASDLGGGRRHCFRIDPADLRAIRSRDEIQTPSHTGVRRRCYPKVPQSKSVEAFLPSV